MNFFEFTDKELFFRNDGELVIIAAWGDNSLRVQSSLMDKIPECCSYQSQCKQSVRY